MNPSVDAATTEAAAPAAPLAPAALAAPTDLPIGWHPFPSEMPKRTGRYIVRLEAAGVVDVEVLTYSAIPVNIPGVHGTCFGFHRGDLAPIQNVTAFRSIPESWLV